MRSRERELYLAFLLVFSKQSSFNSRIRIFGIDKSIALMYLHGREREGELLYKYFLFSFIHSYAVCIFLAFDVKIRDYIYI